MMGGMRALYGGAPAPAPSMALPAASPPPPVGSVPLDDDDFPPETPAQLPARATPPRQPPPKRDSQPRAAGAASGAVWPWPPKKDGDIEKGTPLEDVDDEALGRLIAYCDKKAAEGGRFADRDAQLAEDARAVLASRAGGGGANDDSAPAADPNDRGDSPDAY